MSSAPTPILSLPWKKKDKDYKWIEKAYDRKTLLDIQRGYLFGAIIIFCAVFYGLFVWQFICPKLLHDLLQSFPHSLILFSLLGVIPTVLFLALIGGVYQRRKNEPGFAGPVGEITKLISIIQQLGSK